MDTGKGKFVEIDTFYKDEAKVIEEAKKKYPNHGGVFYVGQNLEFNDSKFRVISITRKTITLRVLPKGVANDEQG